MEGETKPQPIPSRVIHLRNCVQGIQQSDVQQFACPFGAVDQVLILRSKNQALVQFEDISSAQALMQYFAKNTPCICGFNVVVQFSRNQELTAQNRVEEHPNRILLVTILNPCYPVTVDVLSQIFGPRGDLEKIVIFNKSKGLQALVQFGKVESATSAKEYLNGKNIYPGACLLTIQYSNIQTELTVNNNTDMTRDFREFSGAAALAQKPITPVGYGGMGGGMQMGGMHVGMQGGHDVGSLLGAGHHGMMGGGPQGMPMHGQQPTNSSVLLVSNLDDEKVDCTALFNLFSSYGMVCKIKKMTQKADHALVQMGDAYQAATAMQYLKGLKLFWKPMDISFSRHSYINGPPNDRCVDYTTNAANRFRRLFTGDPHATDALRNVSGPTNLLHVSNLTEAITQDVLTEAFGKAAEVRGIKTFEHRNQKQGLVQFADVESATVALVTLNNTPLEGRNIRVSYSKNKL